VRRGRHGCWQSQLAGKRVALFKLLIAFSGETDHDVCGDATSGIISLIKIHCSLILVQRVAPPHPLQHGLASTLQRLNGNADKAFILPQGQEIQEIFPRAAKTRDVISRCLCCRRIRCTKSPRSCGVVFVAANFRPGENNFFVAESHLLLNLVNYPGSGQGIFAGLTLGTMQYVQGL
jgi:hypothetical protein